MMFPCEVVKVFLSKITSLWEKQYVSIISKEKRNQSKIFETSQKKTKALRSSIKDHPTL